MSTIEKVTGKEEIPDWIIEIDEDARAMIEDEHQTILNYLDFTETDIPSRHRTTVLHTDYTPNTSKHTGPNIPRGRTIIRMEFRIGERDGTWGIGDSYDISSLTGSQYYITHDNSNGDSTYVNFFFDPPQTIKSFVQEFQEQKEQRQD